MQGGVFVVLKINLRLLQQTCFGVILAGIVGCLKPREAELGGSRYICIFLSYSS